MFAVQEQLVESQQVHHQMEEELNKVRQVSPTWVALAFCAAITVSIGRQFRAVKSVRGKLKQLGRTRCTRQAR